MEKAILEHFELPSKAWGKTVLEEITWKSSIPPSQGIFKQNSVRMFSFGTSVKEKDRMNKDKPQINKHEESSIH